MITAHRCDNRKPFLSADRSVDESMQVHIQFLDAQVTTDGIVERVLRLEPLFDDQMSELLSRSLERIKAEIPFPAGQTEVKSIRLTVSTKVVSRIISMACGDARKALSLLEVALESTKEATEDQVMEALKQSLIVSYDRSGEDRYDMISALHKSVRGSDGSAAMYWLARMLTAGEDPLFIARRMVVCASEDVGLADRHALPLVLRLFNAWILDLLITKPLKAMAALQACQVIGMPECRINLAHLVAYLSEVPKSTRAYEAYKRAEEAAQKSTTLPVPMQVRNAPTRLMEEMGYGRDYRYNPDYRSVVLLVIESLTIRCLTDTLCATNIYQRS